MRDLNLHLLIPWVAGTSFVIGCQPAGDSDSDPDPSTGGSGGTDTGGAGAAGTGSAAGTGGGAHDTGGSSGIPDVEECANSDVFSAACVATSYCTGFEACRADEFPTVWDSFADCHDETEAGVLYYVEPEGYDLDDPAVVACLDTYKKYYLCVSHVLVSSCDVWADDYEGEPGSDAYECNLAYDELEEVCSF